MPAAPSAPASTATYDVVVVGAGAAGLAVAWRSALAGLQVCVVDPRPLAGASWVAAGMLAPVTELHYGEEALLELNLASARRFPSFVSELEEAVGFGVEYRTCGTLAVGIDVGDRDTLAELHGFHLRLGLESEMLTGRECRQLEPMLSPSVRGGLLVGGDHQVDNRRFVRALLEAARNSGAQLMERAALSVEATGGKVTGLILADQIKLSTPVVVIAAGVGSATVGGLPAEVVPPVRPVKGQLIRLRGSASAPLLQRNLRALVSGSDVYLAPRRDGSVVLGATVEERGPDTAVTAGAIYELLRDAVRVLPGVSELELDESLAGLRPGTPDNAPLLGPTSVEGLVVATGHYRNGILLAPVTGDAIAGYLATGRLPPEILPFSPGRFDDGPGGSLASRRGRLADASEVLT